MINNDKGSALALPAIFVFILILTGLVVDIGLAFAGRNHIRTAAEAASLAGALSVELRAEAVVTPPVITYRYYVRIKPEKAEQAATAMIGKYTGAFGVKVESVSHYLHTEDGHRYTLLDAIGRDDLVFIKHETLIRAEQETLMSFLWGPRFIEIRNIADATVEFTG